MNINQDDGTSAIKPGAELQFNTLREEMIKRIELRHQIVAITLTVAGIVLSFGVSTGSVALVYPPLALFLAMGWIHNNLRIRQLSKYVRDNFEGLIPGLGWETHRQERDAETRLGAWPLNVLSAGGVFLITQVMAISLGILSFEFSPAEWFLLTGDILSLLFVVLLLENFRRRRKRHLSG